jgi:hypothetical protein
MDEKEESCCTIDYTHHKEIFEKRKQAFLKGEDPLDPGPLQGSQGPRRLRHRVRRASGAGRDG